MKYLLYFFALMTLFTGPALAQETARTYSLEPGNFVPGEFIVKFEDGHSPSQLESAVSTESTGPSFLNRVRGIFLSLIHI